MPLCRRFVRHAWPAAHMGRQRKGRRGKTFLSALDRSRICASSNAACAAAERYFCKGKPVCCQAVMPWFMCKILVMPSFVMESYAPAERLPVRQ